MMTDAYEEKRENLEETTSISGRFFWLLVLAFFLFSLGVAVTLIATLLYAGSSENISAVIFIGPFPIVIGSGPNLTLVILLSVILCILSIVVFLVINRSLRRIES